MSHIISGLMQITSLPNDANKLKRFLLIYQQQHVAELEQRDERIKLLEEEIIHLRRLRIASKSEKWTPKDKQQALLFNEAESELDASTKSSENSKTLVKSYRRRKGGRKGLDPSLPRREIIHDLNADEKVCGCGQKLHCVGRDTREELDFTPAKYWVNKHIYLNYACDALCDESIPGIHSAIREPLIIPKSFASAGLLSWLFIDKFENHLPFYRQERILKRLGVDLPRATMCNWAIHVGRKLQRLLVYMRRDLLSHNFIAADETRLQVLNEPNRSNTAQSYMWLFKGGPPLKQVLMYRYYPSRSGKVAKSFIKNNFKGVLLTDGYKGYNALGKRPEISHAGCWAHVRRKFKDAYDAQNALKRDKKYLSFSAHALRYIRILYKLEREIAKNDLSGKAVFNFRQRKSKKVVTFFYKRLYHWRSKVVPESLLGKAIQYAWSERQKLRVFLKDEVVPLDNNGAENAIRPFVLGRKNWLFSGSPRGAKASCAIYSMIATAKANQLDPYWYLRYLFEYLPKTNSKQIHRLTPQQIDPKIIKEYQNNLA